MLNQLYIEQNRSMMLHIEGNRTLDEYGRDVLLTGVNAASLEWDPTPERLMASICEALDNWNANLIRLPLLPNGWYGFLKDQPERDPDGLMYHEFVDEIVNTIAQMKKYVILHLHGCNCGTIGTLDYGDMPDMNSLLFWRDLAERYKNHPNVLFGLFNEPREIGWDLWMNGGMLTSVCEVEGERRVNTFETPGMKKILETVRECGAKNVAVIGGLDWAFTFDGMKDGYLIEDTQGNGIILDSHIYPWKSMDWEKHVACMSDLYPILIGECGHSGEFMRPENPQKEISSIWVPKLLAWIESKRFHATAWDFHHQAGPCLVENLEDFTPTPYWGRYYKEFLARRTASQKQRQTEIEVRVKERAVRFFGRTLDAGKDGMVWFNWSGSGFEFTFRGTKVSAELMTDLRDGKVPAEKDRAQIGVYVDGQSEAVSRFLLDEEKKWYILCEGLPYGTHTVKVVKLSEVGYGRAAVSKLRVFGTMQPIPTQAKERRIEVIGDSISCGYGNICSNASPDFNTWEQDALKTYGAMVADYFNAECMLTAVSGTGAFHDYGMNTHNLIPELYVYTDKMCEEHYGKTAEKWDFARFVPDVILMRLGNNDVRYCECADLEESERTPEKKAERYAMFEIKYREFLELIREKNPEAKILVFWDEDAKQGKEIASAIRYLQEVKKDGRLFGLTIRPKQVEQESVGANGHWSVCTHRRTANQLIEQVKELTGWN